MSPYGNGNPGVPEYRGIPKVRFEAIGEAWQLFSQQMGTWVLSLLVLFGLIGVVYMVFVGGVIGMLVAGSSVSRNGDPGPALGLIFLAYPLFILLILAIASFFAGGLLRMAIKQVRGGAISINDLFTGGDVFLPVLGATLLIVLATYVGLMLLVIPGLIVSGLLFLTFPLIIDQKMGVIQAMKTSWNALKTDLVMATLFALVLPIVAELGVIGCGFGVLFTMPLLYLGMAIVYRDFFLTAPASQYSPNMPYPPPTGYGYVPPTPTVYPAPPAAAYPPPPELTTTLPTEINTPTMGYEAPPTTAWEQPDKTGVLPVETPTLPVETTEASAKVYDYTPVESQEAQPAQESALTPVETEDAPPHLPSDR